MFGHDCNTEGVDDEEEDAEADDIADDNVEGISEFEALKLISCDMAVDRIVEDKDDNNDCGNDDDDESELEWPEPDVVDWPCVRPLVSEEELE